MIRRSFKIILIVALLWLGGFVYYAQTLPQTVTDAERVTDGIVVLTGGRERLPEAMVLLADGKGGRLLISGVNAGIDDPQLQATLGISDGKPADLFACCVDTGREAENTVGNAAEIADWAGDHGYHSLRVVTASYHMPRSLIEIGRYAPGLELVPHPVFPDHVKLGQWWRFPGTARVLASEYNKLVVSLIKAQVVDPVFGAPVT